MPIFGKLLAGLLLGAVASAFYTAYAADGTPPGQRLSLDDLPAAIAAIGTLGTAAYALVDATKALPGSGLSKVGWQIIHAQLTPFSATLQAALGVADWAQVVSAHWINGRPRDEQKAIVKGLVRLGLDPRTAPELEKELKLDPAALAEFVVKLHDGAELSESDIALLGRIDVAIDARLDGAYDLADQRYRNLSRVAAGLVALLLAQVAAAATGPYKERWQLALIAGLLAVPVAPIAKDLASLLQAASAALRGGKS